MKYVFLCLSQNCRSSTTARPLMFGMLLSSGSIDQLFIVGILCILNVIHMVLNWIIICIYASYCYYLPLFIYIAVSLSFITLTRRLSTLVGKVYCKSSFSNVPFVTFISFVKQLLNSKEIQHMIPHMEETCVAKALPKLFGFPLILMIRINKTKSK